MRNVKERGIEKAPLGLYEYYFLRFKQGQTFFVVVVFWFGKCEVDFSFLFLINLAIPKLNFNPREIFFQNKIKIKIKQKKDKNFFDYDYDRNWII